MLKLGWITCDQSLRASKPNGCGCVPTRPFLCQLTSLGAATEAISTSGKRSNLERFGYPTSNMIFLQSCASLGIAIAATA